MVEMSVGRQRGKPLHETVVSSCRVRVSSCTGVIKCCKDPRWPALLDQVANDFIVEVIDRGPFNLLSDILLLLSFQSELDKNLLEFLVDIVDTELFE